MTEDEISRHIIGAAIEVHRTLGGPGLLVPITYKGVTLANPLRLDMLVEQQVIVEVKATSQYSNIFEAQALTYLRLMNLKLALVINFGERQVRYGVHRVVNGL